MNSKTRELLIEAAKAEGVDPDDLLQAVDKKIEKLLETTIENMGQYQVYFIDKFERGAGVLQCRKPDKKSAIEERNRLMQKLGKNTLCEYYVRSPGGYLIP